MSFLQHVSTGWRGLLAFDLPPHTKYDNVKTPGSASKLQTIHQQANLTETRTIDDRLTQVNHLRPHTLITEVYE